MKAFFIAISLAFCACIYSYAVADVAIGSLSASEKHRILSDNFAVKTARSAMPDAVRKAVEGQYPFAEPGQPFQVGCSISPGETLPARRLIFVGSNDDRCLVAYESGGIAHCYFLRVYSIKDGKTTCLGEDCFARPIASLDDVKKAFSTKTK